MLKVLSFHLQAYLFSPTLFSPIHLSEAYFSYENYELYPTIRSIGANELSHIQSWAWNILLLFAKRYLLGFTFLYGNMHELKIRHFHQTHSQPLAIILHFFLLGDCTTDMNFFPRLQKKLFFYLLDYTAYSNI